VPLFLARVYENELVGGIPTPLKNMNLSVPIYGKIKNVPNHQPDISYGNTMGM
jgi:hypothetical protein